MLPYQLHAPLHVVGVTVLAPGMGVQNQAQDNLDYPSVHQEQGFVLSPFALRAWNGTFTCIRGHSAHDIFSLHCAQGSEAFWSQDIWLYKWWWHVCTVLVHTHELQENSNVPIVPCLLQSPVRCSLAVKNCVRLLKTTCCGSRGMKSAIGLSSSWRYILCHTNLDQRDWIFFALKLCFRCWSNRLSKYHHADSGAAGVTVSEMFLQVTLCFSALLFCGILLSKPCLSA